MNNYMERDLWLYQMIVTTLRLTMQVSVVGVFGSTAIGGWALSSFIAI